MLEVAPLELGHAPGSVEAEPATLLHTRPEPRRTRHWHARWSSPATPVSSQERLLVLVSHLASDGDFAGVTDPGSPRWAQTKRIGDRWVVEVHDGHEDWPRVVVPAEGDDAVFASLSTDAGALWTHQAVAGVIWGWLDGALPYGFAVVEAPGG